jgi:hypothetical protein
MKQFFTLLAAVLLTATTYAQVGIGTTDPNGSAALDITSTTKGLLIPRMTNAERGFIDTPATGLMIYQTDSTPGFYYFNSTSWEGYYSKNEVDTLIANLQNQITAAQVVVGEFYQGGVVFYILQSDDLGYVVGETHGLIAAIEDQSDGIRWSDGLGITGASGTAVGTGSVNTDAIINNYTLTGTDFAAGLARAYNGGGYTDWFLPSVEELNKMIINRSAIQSGGEPHGGTLFGGDNIIGNELCSCTTYWSSTEDGPDHARIQDGLSTDFPRSAGHKSNDIRLVRAVRAF